MQITPHSITPRSITPRSINPNFKAVVIKEDGKDYLRTYCSIDDLNYLRDLGQEMKNYKYWDLVITQNGPVVKSKTHDKAYKASGVADKSQYFPNQKYLALHCQDASFNDNNNRIMLKLDFPNIDEAKSADKLLNVSGNFIQKAAVITKSLETRDKTYIEGLQRKQEIYNNKSQLIDDIMNELS